MTISTISQYRITPIFDRSLLRVGKHELAREKKIQIKSDSTLEISDWNMRIDPATVDVGGTDHNNNNNDGHNSRASGLIKSRLNISCFFANSSNYESDSLPNKQVRNGGKYQAECDTRGLFHYPYGRRWYSSYLTRSLVAWK